MKPKLITFTGLDAQTDLVRCAALSVEYPIEWGFLFGGSIGQNRYPQHKVAEAAMRAGLRMSAHLCGRFAREANTGANPAALKSFCGFARVQVNTRAGAYDLVSLQRFGAWIGKKVIVQHRNSVFPTPISGIEYLQDTSGGRGQLPSYWAKPDTPDQYVGYAGGLNPDNVADAVRHIPATNFWIDMETGVRTDDWLDLDKCEAVCRAVYGTQET